MTQEAGGGRTRAIAITGGFHFMSATASEAVALHWEDLPIIVVSSLVQGILGGLIFGMLTGGIIGAFFGQFWAGTQLVAWPVGLLLFAASVVAGLLPEVKKVPLLEMPKAD